MVLSAVLHWLCSQSIFLVSIRFDHHAMEFPDQKCLNRDGLSYSSMTSCTDEFLTCGYSPTAILSTICVGAAMLAFLLVAERFKFKDGGMPVTGSCSAAISAACHSYEGNQLGQSDTEQGDRFSVHTTPLQVSEDVEDSGLLDAGELDAACRPVQWGDMGFYTELTGGLVRGKAGKFSGNASLVTRGRRVGHCGFSSPKVKTPVKGGLYAGSLSSQQENIGSS
jgi:hypothetical protein